MLEIFDYLRGSRPFRYIFIGGISYLVELGVLLGLTSALLLSPELSVAISFWIGLVVSFLMQKYLTFSNKLTTRMSLSKQALLYGALVAFNYIFTIVFVSLFVGFFGLIESRTAALVITTLWNYFIYREIFKDNR